MIENLKGFEKYLGKEKVQMLRESTIEELFELYNYARKNGYPYGPLIRAIEMALYDKWPGHKYADRIYTLNNLTYKDVQEELKKK